jgi:hypothetical protein
MTLAIFGLAPLDHLLDIAADPVAMRAASCGECHAEQYADWSASRHASAHQQHLPGRPGCRAAPVLRAVPQPAA